MSKVPIDAVPDITNNQVQVITQAPNLGTEDIEQFVTYPVELAMANLPSVTEIRSISRFGLSLVTIVFEDKVGTYLPRQLVQEKLLEVRDEIPEGFGTPTMGPISTGLGEIYQYTLEVDEAHQHQYSTADLRTMQDWIIRRQMAMVPGVIEVNAFGGDVKQYEVAVKPHQLKAMGISLSEVFSALEKNNQNTGGAYIEKDHQANFIRGEGLAKSIEDIERIPVKYQNGLPITIKDLATVRMGRDVKYGAFTKDGKGEAVGGMILMLKGANSRDVINRVKERVALIQKSLPEGVEIVPFLDRSNLIKNTTQTVSTNLMEGALIVIFVLVFLLGNWRGGLIVASTIPLSLLFAFILMNAFGVWANLMSLGAIDFGIIIDGAVIIVESTVFLFYTQLKKGKALDRKNRETLTRRASTKMMNSAFFGQLIILIVFIPILALEGVEGKMFKPMALTFMFAMVGVMLLCLTYVPMMSAWLLKVNPDKKDSWGDKLIHWVEGLYSRLLQQVLKVSWAIVLLAVGLLVTSGWLFSKLGGEFIPQLEEGDIAFHSILKPGSSLTETIETTTKIENIIVSNFPEVKRVLCRIGVADVPTDPMPMDIADCFIILKPQKEWQWKGSKEELVEAIKQEVMQVPGINFEFTQPIEMRFNELLTGVREDVAVKLFGEDLDLLAAKAEEIGKVVATVQGVADMKVESTKGLPQITINYQRAKLAQYGLHISDINTLVQSAFAGGKAGVIFEGEKRFDLVVRLHEQSRRSIDDVKNLFVTLLNGSQIPLKEVAQIAYEPGPMQISRDNTNRRVYVGVNVRGRDVKSVVEEIRTKVENQVDLPSGYYIRYGGAFENLERAEERLKVVVPIALGLIFLLIFFALKSLKQTAMIYVSIPLAAIGGVFSLWLRDMPFSISAGVGFIVLFGVAVLNGLVLISGWNEMKANNEGSLAERIAKGAKRRIRPILLTALTDVLGFLPMAISTSAGAEVQRPLATVVIGGMISATLLTLFILPILYKWLETREMKRIKPSAITTVLVVAFLALGPSLKAQDASLSLKSVDEAIAYALANNPAMKAAKTKVDMQQVVVKGAFNPDKTSISLQYGQFNSFENDFGVDINQQIAFPSVYARQRQLAKQQVKSADIEWQIAANELKRNVRQSWFLLNYWHQRKALISYQDSINQNFLKAVNLRYEVEAANQLEKSVAEMQYMESQNRLKEVAANMAIEEQKLKILLNVQSLDWTPTTLESSTNEPALEEKPNHPLVDYAQQEVQMASTQKQVQKAQMLPDISVGYMNQSFIGNPTADGQIADASNRYTGVRAGLSVPLFYKSFQSGIQQSQLQEELARNQAEYQEISIQGQFEIQKQELEKNRAMLDYFEKSALPQAELLLQNANLSFENEAINYIEYFQLLKKALDIQFGHLESLSRYQQTQIHINYLLGK